MELSRKSNTDVNKMKDRINTEEENLKLLAKAFSSVKDEEECRAFLLDLCTKAEIKEMARRIIAAQMLYQNEQYITVSATTGLSTATISRVSRCLKSGDGYPVIIPRITEKE
ncbi:MAG: YerC/YecD family TrpR-related protein [Eubacteriales bacterium]|nr:YerC/YecD family TrpR-related protein [Eubacteriales bacterium]